MHHPHSISDARRLRIASLLLLINRLLIVSGGTLLLFALMANDRYLPVVGSGLLITSCMLIIAQWIAASRAGCPLCRTPVLAPMGCMMHRKARSLLGSYQLRVALAIVMKERFRCPYCNESTSMDVPERLRDSRPRGSRATRFSRYQ